jgi:predicted nucleic acid-binding protein
MTAPPLVLDADGLAALSEAHPPEGLRALLSEAFARGRDVVVPTVVCAEVCRGSARTRSVEAAVTRRGTDRGRGPVRCLDTDFSLARRVGAILHAAGADSRDLVDAHVVGVCAGFDTAVVATSDPADILRLAEAVPGTRIITRSPR